MSRDRTAPDSLPTIAVDLRALIPTPTGVGVYTRSLLTALARRGSAHYIGLAHASVHWAEDLRAAGVEVEIQPVPLGQIWHQFCLPWRLRRRSGGSGGGRRSIDLLLSPLGIQPWWTPVPGVVTVHDLTVLLHPETHHWKTRATMVPFLRQTLRRAARVVASSEATAADLRRYEPACASKLSVVHLGADPEFQPGTPAQIATTRYRLGCAGGYLLYVGTLEPRKNVGRLLDAWEALRRDDPKTPPLVIAGASGWRNSELRRRLESLREGGQGAGAAAPPGLHLLGHIDRRELVEVFQAATAFLYPSLYEGFGLPPAEAMACGVPVVVSNVSSLPEVVGDAGLQVPPHDAGALKEAIHSLLQDPVRARTLGQEGRERAARFTWERTATEMERVFGEVLDGESGPVAS